MYSLAADKPANALQTFLQLMTIDNDQNGHINKDSHEMKYYRIENIARTYACTHARTHTHTHIENTSRTIDLMCHKEYITLP